MAIYWTKMAIVAFFAIHVLIWMPQAVYTTNSNEVTVEEVKSDLVRKSFEASLNFNKIVDEEVGINKLNQILQVHESLLPDQVVSNKIKSIAAIVSAKINEYRDHIQNSNNGQFLIEEDLKQNIGSLLDDRHEHDPDGLDPPSFVYHRLDKLPTRPKLCKYFKQLATLETSALFLSTNAFQNPLGFISEPETTHQIQQFNSYFTNCSRDSANSDLKPNIKDEVLSLTRITKTWKDRTVNSSLSKYIVRRYIASQSGVFVVYPGTVLERSYHPTQRDWYRRAVHYPDRTIFTAPYLDVGGAGYIVTLSRTFQSKKLDGSGSTLQGVAGLDFTLGYFHKLLMNSMDVCSKPHITCFLMDDRGYLVAHPSLVEPAGRGPVEHTHITHKEPLVANDLLNHKNFVKKRVCNSFADCTIQRYYNLNMSLDGLLSNLVHGEHCAKYQIAAIPGTNIFIGVVNQTCDSMSAFCPCSMTDRLCLNCHRMEQTDCECPCECPLETCSNALDDDSREEEDDCNPYSEELVLPIVERTETVASCFQVDCSTRKSESDCLGVLGCEWCQLDTSGTDLDQKFCNYQRECFGGVLGVRTPYADEVSDNVSFSELPFSRVTPFSSIIFVSITCFVILSFVVCCYRFHVHRAACGLYPSDIRDTNVRMSQLDNEPEELDPVIEDIVKPLAQANVVVMLANAAAVSPYRLNPGYRRPPGGDSDNGYSTMTAHDDSEHLGPVFDPLLAGRDKHIVPASVHSLGSSSRTSSPLETSNNSRSSLPIPMTVLPPSKVDMSVIAQIHNVVDAH